MQLLLLYVNMRLSQIETTFSSLLLQPYFLQSNCEDSLWTKYPPSTHSHFWFKRSYRIMSFIFVSLQCCVPRYGFLRNFHSSIWSNSTSVRAFWLLKFLILAYYWYMISNSIKEDNCKQKCIGVTSMRYGTAYFSFSCNGVVSVHQT